jgi:RHS repeat-associated protein
VYFDELKITHVKSRVLQESHYYPFGLAMSTSWTRETAVNNNYLYNAGSELNDNTQWYEMFFRGYDPALGRMLQIDPVASKYASVSPYNYSFNDPVALNDPTGADPYQDALYYALRVSNGGSIGAHDQKRNENIIDPGFGRYDGAYSTWRGPLYDSENKKWFLPEFKNGEMGYWVTRKYWDVSTMRMQGDELIGLPSLIVNSRWVRLDRSLSHYRTMSNPLVQHMHSQSAKFMEHPFGAAFMFLATGGPAGGGLASIGRSVVARAASQVATRTVTHVGKQAVHNLVSSGMKNMLVNTSTQLIFNGFNFNEIDIADVAISGVAGNSFGFAAVAGSLINYDLTGNFSTGFADPYKGFVDLSTGLVFGAASNQVGLVLGTKNIGEGLKNTTQFTFEMYEGLFNYTVSKGNPNRGN